MLDMGAEPRYTSTIVAYSILVIIFMKRYIHSFDRKLIANIVALPDWVRPTMLLATLIGQPPITVGVAGVVIGYGLALDKPYMVISGTIAAITFVVSSVLKVFLRRTRPENEYVRNMIIQTFSFPSGHAAGALASFGMIGLLFGDATSWSMMSIIGVAVIVMINCMIGVSRVYLGAHYPSDIIGGWIVGAIGLGVIYVSVLTS